MLLLLATSTALSEVRKPRDAKRSLETVIASEAWNQPCESRHMTDLDTRTGFIR